MSIRHFLTSCKSVLENERVDYSEVCNRISDDAAVYLQPLTGYDFLPMYTIERRLSAELPFASRDQVYIMPVTDFFEETLTRDLSDFYLYDELPDLHCVFFEDFEFCQSILLLQPRFRKQRFSSMDVNVIYVELAAGNRHFHLFLCLEKTENVWECLAKEYGCPPLMLIDSNKGFLNWFPETALYSKLQDCEDPTILPKFYFSGPYVSSSSMPPDFLLICSRLVQKEETCLYLTSWGREDSEAFRVYCEITEKEAARKRKIEALRNRMDAFVAEPIGEPPVDEMKAYLKFCREDMEADQGVTDFSNQCQQVYYPLSRNIEEFTPTLCLNNRANYFLTLALLAVFDSREGRAGYFSKLKKLFLFHIQRAESERLHPDAYIFIGARYELRSFVYAIYEHVKMLSQYEPFAYWFGDSLYNMVEEEMLRYAYQKKDAPFADWIIENCFHGRVQSELFTIIYQNDRQKAANVASRLAPVCAAWILTETCRVCKRANRMEISDEIRFVFENIDQKSALDMDQYIRRYKKTAPEYLDIYKQLLKEYFGIEGVK